MSRVQSRVPNWLMRHVNLAVPDAQITPQDPRLHLNMMSLPHKIASGVNAALRSPQRILCVLLTHTNQHVLFNYMHERPLQCSFCPFSLYLQLHPISMKTSNVEVENTFFLRM